MNAPPKGDANKKPGVPRRVAKGVVHALVEVERHIFGLKPTFFKFFGRLGKWTRKTIKLLIPLGVLLFFTFAPLGIRPIIIQYTLGVFLCISIMWALESLPLPVTSLLAPALLVLYGVFGATEQAATDAFAPFARPVVYVILGGLIIAEAFRRNGIDKRLSFYLISRSKGRFKWLLLAVMFGAALLSMWISNTATAALLIPVTIGIAHRVAQNSEEGHDVAVVLLLGVAASTIIGGMATIIGSSPNAVASGFLAQETEWGFVQWMIIGLPLSMMILLLSWALLLHFFPVGVDVIDISWVEDERKELGPMSNDEKKVMIVFGGAVVFWIFGEGAARLMHVPVPFIGGFASAAIVGVLAAVLLFVTHALDWEDAKLIPWGLFLIVGAGLSLGEGMIASGCADWLGNGLISATDFLSALGPLHVVVLLMVISLVAVALSNFMNNTATAAIFVPILISMAVPLGEPNVKVVVLPVAFSMVLAFATPVATPSSTLVYGTGMVSKKELMKSGIIIAVPAVILTVVFSYVFALFGWV